MLGGPETLLDIEWLCKFEAKVASADYAEVYEELLWRTSRSRGVFQIRPPLPILGTDAETMADLIAPTFLTNDMFPEYSSTTPELRMPKYEESYNLHDAYDRWRAAHHLYADAIFRLGIRARKLFRENSTYYPRYTAASLRLDDE